MRISSCCGSGTARFLSHRSPVEDCGDEAIDRLLIEPVLATKYLPRSGCNCARHRLWRRLPSDSDETRQLRAYLLRMVESKTRKAAFLREVVRTLELDRTNVDAVRFEELLARPSLHDAMDVVTMRAVRVDRKTLSELQSFVRPGGFIFLFRHRDGRRARESAGPYLSSHGKPCTPESVGKLRRDLPKDR